MSESVQASISAVAIKLPSIWKDDVDTWFRCAECQFVIRYIVDEKTKFHHGVAVLCSSISVQVKAAIRAPPPSGSALDCLENSAAQQV